MSRMCAQVGAAVTAISVPDHREWDGELTVEVFDALTATTLIKKAPDKVTLHVSYD